ncbi:MAG TPA: hypothetical protein VHU61_04820 [Solirubrobacteraceae bacterium]|jgi:hypothetical protein|nr:hypothetical protein [Solirubrobacteraceae bacterium]
MRFKPTRIVAAIAVIGAVAAGGAAFTDSNTVPDTTAGYGTATVSGGTVDSLSYTLSTDGTSLTQATVVFDGDTTGDTASIAFNAPNTDLQTCDAGTLDSNSNTTYTCPLTGITTADETSVQIALVNNPATGV